MKAFIPLKAVLFLSFATIVFWCCENTDTKNDMPIGEPFTVAYKQKLENSREHISLLFDSVRSDSRCPINANCISAGNAEIKFVFEISKIDIKARVNTNTDPKSFKSLQYTIELISLSPFPSLDKPLVPSDYSALVKITSN